MSSQRVLVASVCFVLVGAGAFVYRNLAEDAARRHDFDSPAQSTKPPELVLPPKASRVEVADTPSITAITQQASLANKWSKQNAEAIAALEAGETELAIELFEACVAGDPDEPIFAGNLAEALARRAVALYEVGEVPLAEPIALLERAVLLAPQREHLSALLARWKKTAATEEAFWTDESAHFLLSYDGERRDLLQRGYLQLEEMLESAYDEFGVAFNHYPIGHGDPKIRVVLYQRAEFEEVTGIGHWAGGVYDGVVRIPVVEFDRQRNEIERVLRHELVHAFVRSQGGKDVPAWLNEGLAQWHEDTSPGKQQLRIEAARQELRGQELFPLEKLHGSLASWSDEKAIARGYAESLAFVNYVALSYGKFLLYEMLAGCRAGETCEASFQARTGLSLSAVLEDLANELRTSGH